LDSDETYGDVIVRLHKMPSIYQYISWFFWSCKFHIFGFFFLNRWLTIGEAKETHSEILGNGELKINDHEEEITQSKKNSKNILFDKIIDRRCLAFTCLLLCSHVLEPMTCNLLQVLARFNELYITLYILRKYVFRHHFQSLKWLIYSDWSHALLLLVPLDVFTPAHLLFRFDVLFKYGVI